jgi:hypothetical protein
MKKILGIFVCMLLIATAMPVLGEISELKSEIKTEKIGIQPNPQGSGRVFTDRFIYQTGQSVHITFLNNGQDTVDFGGPPMFRIYRLTFIFIIPAWGYIYPDWVHLVLFWLDPGESRTETWDQKTSDGIQVLPGIYRVDVPYFDHYTNSPQNASNYFLII